VRPQTALLTVVLVAAGAFYAWRGHAEMTWQGSVATRAGVLAPPREVGRLWILSPARRPVVDAVACRERIREEAVARGLTASGASVPHRRNRPPVPSLVRWREHGRCALLLERAPHAARLVDPALGEVVLLDRDLSRWLEDTAVPLTERHDP